MLTLACGVVGILIALGVRRWAAEPRTVFVRIAVALTALSFVPDLTFPADTATRLTLMLTHLTTAAIVIPVIARNIDARGR